MLPAECYSLSHQINIWGVRICTGSDGTRFPSFYCGFFAAPKDMLLEMFQISPLLSNITYAMKMEARGKVFHGGSLGFQDIVTATLTGR